MADSIMKVSEFFTVDNFIVLRLEHEEEMKIDLEWLRDHCRCDLCFNVATHQRKLTLLDFPSTVRPDSFIVFDEKLHVTWNDGHRSTYNTDWLKRNIRYEGDDIIDTQIPWTNQPNMEVMDYEGFMKDENGVIAILKSILQYGVAMIIGAKPSLEVTEEVCKKIAPVQKTLFGEMWELNHDLTEVSHKDTAYTHDSLDFHTDNTYWSDAAGLQIFHCYKPADSGGETLLIDGLKLVEDLKLKHQACYKRLCKTPVSATYIEEGQCHEHVDPIIKLHPVTKKLLQIRFNLYDRSIVRSVRQTDIATHYKDLRTLESLVKEPERKFSLGLKTGEIVIMDNWRVLHGRNSYNGTRHLGGCYISRTDWRSKAATLGLLN